MSKYFIITLFIILYSCKGKIDPVEKQSNPVFVFSAELEEDSLIVPVNFISGVDGIFMYSSFEKDDDGVYNFIGDYGDIDGNSKLKISFRDYKEREPNEKIDIENVIIVGKGAYKGTVNEERIFYKAYFNNSSYSGSSYMFNFGDGNILPIQTGSFSHIYSEKRMYMVDLIATHSICNSVIHKEIYVDEVNCFVDFDFNLDTNNFLGTGRISEQGSTGPYEYIWSIDGNTGLLQGSDTSWSYYFSLDGVKLIEVEQLDGNLCVSKASKNVDVYYGFPSYCMANFEYMGYEEIVVNNLTYFNSIYVEWTDEDGTVYSTKYTNQEGNIKITSVEEFDVNENGEKTIKVDVEFDCTLYNEEGESKELVNAKATLAVAYPS